MGRGQKGQPFRRSAAFTEPVMPQETQGKPFQTFTRVQFIDHYCWIVAYPPSAASLGSNDVLCQWKFIVFSSRDNKLLQCYDSLFLWAHLMLSGALRFRNTHLHKCWIAQKNAEDVTIKGRRVFRKVPVAGLRSRKNTYQDGSRTKLCTADQRRQECRIGKAKRIGKQSEQTADFCQTLT